MITEKTAAPTTFRIVSTSLLWATYESILALLPVLVWGVTLISIGKEEQVVKLSAWPFLSLSIFITILRDGLKAFHRESAIEDKLIREVIVCLSVIGSVVSSVLLMLSILHSQNLIGEPSVFFYKLIFLELIVGLVFLICVKSILFQRTEYGRYT